MSVVAVIIILGAQCISPLDGATNATTAYKVPCAIVYTADNPPPKIVTPEAKPAPKAKKKSCRKKYYWKNHKKRWRCVK